LSTPHKIYFASDFHLGVPDEEQSRAREARLVQWLDMASKDAAEIFLVGDVFDFWFEYKTVIPKGFVRLQGKIAEITDAGIPVHYFTGNHDMWAFGYFEKELGVKMYRQPITRFFNGAKFMIGHGDGLGPGDHGYKFIKKVFANPFCQWAFRQIHPDLGIRIASFFSGRSRAVNLSEDLKYLGDDREWLAVYCREILKETHFDYFIFGHRHLPIDIKVGAGSRYVNLGEWMRSNTYAVWDGTHLELLTFNP
jgi:UDP-2,3-diacylglucosamine hydrolase